MVRGIWLLVSLVLLGACERQDKPVEPDGTLLPSPAIQVSLVEVQSMSVPVRVEVTGQVAATSQAMLSSQVQSAVQEIRVREGSLVKKGETLVVLDSRDLRADLARVEAELENAKAHVARMRQLFTQDSVAKQELENAERTFKVAEANRKAALTRVSYTRVTAPFDGLVTEKMIEAGELASPGRALLRMEDPRRLRLEATVAEGDLKAVSRGDKVKVTIDALQGQVLKGTVALILPTGDPSTHTFLVKVDLPETAGLKTGMFGRMQLDTGTGQSLVIPRKSVVERGELTGVYVVGSDALAHLRWVKLGRSLDGAVEILSGLNVGEQILVDGTKGVDGARVEVIQAVAGPQASGAVP